MNDTLSAEAQAVDEIIAAENRAVWIRERIAYIEERMSYVNVFGFRWTKWMAECDELEAELSDIERMLKS